jgi:hypothetical protein
MCFPEYRNDFNEFSSNNDSNYDSQWDFFQISASGPKNIVFGVSGVRSWA